MGNASVRHDAKINYRRSRAEIEAHDTPIKNALLARGTADVSHTWGLPRVSPFVGTVGLALRRPIRIAEPADDEFLAALYTVPFAVPPV